MQAQGARFENDDRTATCDELIMTMSIKQLREKYTKVFFGDASVQFDEDGLSDVFDIAEAALRYVACGGKILHLPAPDSRNAYPALKELIAACQKVKL